MFGLTFERLVLVLVIAVVVVGPQRLPVYTRRLTQLVRSLKTFVKTTRRRAEQDLGVPLDRADWQQMDLRQYDPRRIVRDALSEVQTPRSSASGALEETSDDGGGTTPATADQATGEAGPELAADGTTRPRGRWVVTGGAAHPRRVFVPDDDPQEPS